MYMSVNKINPRAIQFSDCLFFDPDAIVFKFEDQKVFKHTDSGWELVFESKDLESRFFGTCRLMIEVMGMHAENLTREMRGEAVAYTENKFEEICQEMSILGG